MEKLMMLVVSLMVTGTAGGPRGFSLAQLQQLGSEDRAVDSAVRELGQLSTLHAVGLATNPTNQDKLIYADETALYEFDKNTGKSSLVAGQASSGLLALRSSADGVESEVAFKYITKIVARPSGLFIFDYDSLRKYDFNTKKVETLAKLSDDKAENKPIVGVISSDENRVYWTTTTGEGHLVMLMQIAGGEPSTAELVTGGPTLIGHLELTEDEEYLLLADVDMALVEKVRIRDGEVTFVTRYGQDGFFPGAMAMNGEDLYVINRDAGSINSYDLAVQNPSSKPLCGSTCLNKISNPFDIIYDARSSQVFVLDGAYHPSLPTYLFTIKSISVTTTVRGVTASSPEYDAGNLMQLFSRWLSEANGK